MNVEHRIFPSTSARMAAIAREARDLLGQGCGVMVATHFSSDLPVVEQALSSAGVAASTFATPFDLQGIADVLAGDAPFAALVLAKLLSPQSLAGVRPTTGRQLAWIVAQHHPTVAGDEAILEIVRALPATSMVCFYDSLDTPLFLRFGGERVQHLWAGLNLEQDQCVSHPIVTRTIRQAQEKIAKQARSNLDAASAEAWFRQNLS
ncbi:MAG: hypothetical protein MUC88_28110 [Planctomycetes bacterium]|nr:hypothetical protein [Planctomycetota bacterium]